MLSFLAGPAGARSIIILVDDCPRPPSDEQLVLWLFCLCLAERQTRVA